MEVCPPVRTVWGRYAAKLAVALLVVAIAVGVGAALVPAPEKWTLYAVSCVAYVALRYGLLRSLPAALER